ncbi:MAG: hypothetical protein K9M11_00615 [Candidatus Pacebacteria bacterium]|nr:hypothetical protein [Candidatus Paceibacterota bacterium]
MKINTPPEPLDLKALMQSMKQSSPESSDDASIVWTGNKLPKYLWDNLKSQLKAKGFTWQTFMRVLRHRTDICILWYKGEMTWNDFILSLQKLIDSSIGNEPKSTSSSPVDIAQWQVPPPREWEKFERLSADLWQEIWNDHNLVRYGRSGQRQNGIDILGKVKETQKLGAIQCKKKDATSNETADALSVSDIQDIVDEAKKFNPPLTELVIAYTGKRDTSLQQAALKISMEHATKGMFSVHVFSWDDILEKLGNFGNVASKYYPALASSNVDPSLSDAFTEKLGNIEKKVGDGLALINESVAANTTEKKEIAQMVFDTTAIASEHAAEIDHGRDLINNMKPKEALDFLEGLEKRIWSSANDISKFRILTNKAAALASLHREKEAGSLFIQAHQYNPEDEKSLCNRALGHLMLDQTEECKTYIRKVLDKNPASTRAIGILINCSPKTQALEDILKDIPAEFRKSEDVAFTIAHAARERGDLASSIKWLEIAMEDSIKIRKKNPDIQANLASTILETFMQKHEVANNMQLIPEDKEKIEKAVQLLSEAIDSLSNSESISYRPSWYANRATAYKLLGEMDKANADMASAVRYQPEDAAMLKQQAFMLYSKGERKQAIEILKTVVGKKEVPEAAYVLAGIYFDENNLVEARETLIKSFSDDLPPELRSEEERMLVHVYIKEKNYEKAKKIVDKLRSFDPTNIENLIAASRTERFAGNKEAAGNLLDEAYGYITDMTPAHIVINLADDLYNMQKYAQSWPLYEKIIDPRVPSPHLDNLFYSYYRANEVDKALSLFKRLPDENKGLFLLQIELSILENIGDLSAASAAAEKYLLSHPDDLEIKTRLATHWFRLDEFEKLDKFLDEDIDITQLPINPGFQLAQLYAERNKVEKSLEAAYQLRRKYFDDGEAHAKYMTIFLAQDHKLEKLLEIPKTAVISSAVYTKNDADQITCYLLEDRKDLSMALNEIGVSSGIGEKLLGRSVNDDVVVSEGAISKIVVKITEIKNKYVHALHESMRLMPERFSEQKSLERFSVDVSSEEKTKESLDKVLQVVSNHSEYVSQAEKLYIDMKLTVGAFASVINKNIVDVWYGLSASVGIRSCVGTLEERQVALDSIKTNDTIAIDITSLLTLSQLGLLEMFKDKFKKVLVTQSTIDTLNEAISERKGMGSKGSTTLGKMDGSFIRDEKTPEQAATEVEALESLKKWIRENCTLTPCKTLPKTQQFEEMEKVLGKYAIETILIAKENECSLYAEDLATRMYAKNDDFKVNGVWTQAILMHFLIDKKISSSEYWDAVIKLVLRRYQHVTLESTTLIEAARQAQWENQSPFKEVLATLKGVKMELRSVVGVLADFMFLLWQQPVTDKEREGLIMTVLDALTFERDARTAIELIRSVIRIRFASMPLAGARMQQIISAWESLNIK